MLPVADGNDHTGSLRNPAAFNNVFAFRPSASRALDNTRDICMPTLSVTGPIARTVTDLARAWSVHNGSRSIAPLTPTKEPNPVANLLTRELKGTRIAWLGDFGGYLAIEPGLMDLCENAFRVFEELGCNIEPARPAYPLHRLWDAWLTLRAWQIGRGLKWHAREPDRATLLRPQARWEIERGSRVSAYDVHSALLARRAWCHQFFKLFETYGYLLLPAAQAFPFDAKLQGPQQIAGRTMETYHRWMEVMIPVTMSGCPALSVPVGFNRFGLPMGLQIIARNDADQRCFQLARAYEQATA
jgi:amidase